MLEINEFFAMLEELAPLKLSELSVKDGGYDNSGIIAKTTNQVNGALFSLDLSLACVQKAIELSADTIVTHHPAIYYPIKNLSVDGENGALLTAIKNGISVISLHLNLDVADGGIDESLAKGLSGRVENVLDMIDKTHGYGREGLINCELAEFTKKVKTVLETDKVLCYGSGICKKMASFCGGGASHALKAIKDKTTDADLIITSDLAHHEIKEIIESGKKLIIIPHYASEHYGFKKFYECVKKLTLGKAEAHYFLDKRFM